MRVSRFVVWLKVRVWVWLEFWVSVRVRVVVRIGGEKQGWTQGGYDEGKKW